MVMMDNIVFTSLLPICYIFLIVDIDVMAVMVMVVSDILLDRNKKVHK